MATLNLFGGRVNNGVSGRCAILTAAAFVLVTVATSQVQAQSLISLHYQSLGGAKSPLGTPIGNEQRIARGGYQKFQNGEITWSPHCGGKCLLTAYWNPKAANSVVVQWGPTDPFQYDIFIVRVHNSQGKEHMQRDLRTGSQTRKGGQYIINNLERNRSWTIMVEGADRGESFFGGTKTTARQGWMNAVTLLGRAPQQGGNSGNGQPRSTTPVISVSTRSQGGFVVSGSGFLPNAKATIRVAAYAPGQVQNAWQFGNNVSSSGTFTANVNVPCLAGTMLYFSAMDGRKNSKDLTGNLWSNTVSIRCPGQGGISGQSKRLEDQRGSVLNRRGQDVLRQNRIRYFGRQTQRSVLPAKTNPKSTTGSLNPRFRSFGKIKSNSSLNPQPLPPKSTSSTLKSFGLIQN